MKTLGFLYRSGALTADVVLSVLRAQYDEMVDSTFIVYCTEQEIPSEFSKQLQSERSTSGKQTIILAQESEESPKTKEEHKASVIAGQDTLILDMDSTIATEESTVEIISSAYEDLGAIAAGGMGQVRRVSEHKFHRQLAMKVIHPHLRSYPIMIEKFREEAQVISQLQHPNIIPVHDMGCLDDGREYYTMKEIRGAHLGEHIFSVHHARKEGLIETKDGWNLRRLIGTFHQACLGVAHAHRHNVIHRDLKPENIMVEPTGIAIVMDWGLAKLLSQEKNDKESQMVITGRGLSGAFQTMVGQVTGTPAYMSPEQARGENDSLTYTSDVYSLGTILYEILTGMVPYQGDSAADILSQVIEGPPKEPSFFTPQEAQNIKTLSLPGGFSLLKKIPAPVEATEDPFIFPRSTKNPVPEVLIEICTKAMDRNPDSRFVNAEELADSILDWLDGAKKREQGLAVVKRALQLDDRIAVLRKRAEKKKQEAKDLLENIASWRGENEKAAGWEAEDLAAELLLQAEIHEVEKEQLLKASLSHKEDLEEAHLPLIEEYFHQHRTYEENKDRKRRKQVEIHLRYHTEALSPYHATRTRISSYLKGVGSCTLHISRNAVHAQIQRFISHNRRLVLSKAKPLDISSIREIPLQQGSYLISILGEHGVSIQYPIRISRLEHWNPIHPKSQREQVVHIPSEAISDCIVSAGWFFCGGDQEALNVLPRTKVWLDGFVMQKYPVTNREYLIFLNSLLNEGREDEALLYVPRERVTKNDQEGEMVYRRDLKGLFHLLEDPKGALWNLDYPVCMVSWHSARAYADWKRSKTGVAWRLPTELEWEKAARGVDERVFVWGNFFDSSWTRSRYTLEGTPKPATITEYPIDESVYGVRGLAGNMCEWTSSLFFEEGVPIIDGCPVPEEEPNQSARGRVRRGGSWYYDSRISRAAFRYPDFPDFRNSYISFRLVYSLSS